MAISRALCAAHTGTGDAKLAGTTLGVDLAGGRGVGIFAGAKIADMIARAVLIALADRIGEGKTGASVAALARGALGIGGTSAGVLANGVDTLTGGGAVGGIGAEGLGHAAIGDALKAIFAVCSGGAACGLAIAQFATLV